MNEKLEGIELILFDMEVYKYDWIAGFKIHNTGEYIQIHNNKKDLELFLTQHSDAIYFTINGERYDDNILDAILNNKDPYLVSQIIISEKKDLRAWNLPVLTYDLSKQKTFYPSLKAFESNNGMSIEELPIEATFDSKLNSDQLNILMKYNRHDLDATELSMTQRMSESIMVKARLIKYFNLDFVKYMSRTKGSIIADGLEGRKRNFKHQAFSFDGIFSTLEINNSDVKDHLINERFYDDDLIIEIAGITHHIKKGGIHAAKDNYYESNDAWHVDFASFYPSIMIEYDLLSRGLGENGKEKFIKVREDRYKAKAAGSLDDYALKEVINSVFGLANSEYSSLYDPSRAQLVCMYGQAFAIDLTEKLEPYVNMIQSNTDGIIFELKDPNHENVMRKIIADFTERTRLKMDIEHYDKICQKDVNNYVALLEGEVQSKGGMTNLWNMTPDNAHYKGTYRLLQTTVIDRAVTLNLLYGTNIEHTVKESYNNKEWYRFQGTSKIGKMYHKVVLVEEPNDFVSDMIKINIALKSKEVKSILKDFNIKIKDYDDFINQYENDNFDDDQLELLNTLDIKIINSRVIETEVQHINRVFASNDSNVVRTLYKYKWIEDKKSNNLSTSKQKISRSLIANLPKNVFIYNGDMKDFESLGMNKQIDINWYVEEAERKLEFYKSNKN